MKLPGKISINRTTSNREESYVSIEITDERSHIGFCRIKISMTEFGNAITGLSFRPCELDLLGLEKVGKFREYKEEVIYISSPSLLTSLKEKAAEVLAPYEIDGWIGSRDDLINHHRQFTKDDGKSYARVGFVRFVANEN